MPEVSQKRPHLSGFQTIQFYLSIMTKSDVHVIMENVTEEEIIELNKDLPTDVHLIEYCRNQELHLDAVRAYKMVDIFDYYYDKLNQEALDLDMTFEIKSIKSGYGNIKPKLFVS